MMINMKLEMTISLIKGARDYDDDDDDDEPSLFGSLPEWWKLLRNWQDLQVRSKQCDSIGRLSGLPQYQTVRLNFADVI